MMLQLQFNDRVALSTCNRPVDPLELQTIRNALQRGQLTGNTRFTEEVEQLIGKRIEVRAQGRPGGGK